MAAPFAERHDPQNTNKSKAVPGERLPLNTFAIAFGLAGLANLWVTAARLLAVSEWIGQALWIIATVTWVWLIVAHVGRGIRSTETLGHQLRHPAQGPLAALVPAVGMLLGADVALFAPVVGATIVLLSIAAAAVFAAWILAFWHTGRLTPEAFHGGYLLPTVGAALIAATTAHRVGFTMLSIGCFAVGIFFWVVISTVVLARLAFFAPLPDALTPTCAILLAPPAVGTTAWFTINGGRVDLVATALLGLLVLLFLQQLALIPRYRRLPFSLGFWSFTFPLAAAGACTIQWLSLEGFVGWPIVAACLLAIVTVLVGAVAVKSLLLVRRAHGGAHGAETVLRRADEAVERR